MTLDSSARPSPLVTVVHVTKTYGSAAGAVAALADVSFTIAPGQLVALVGRSGSGKTTLLNCVGGLDEPTSGRIVVNGKDVTAMDESARTALRRDELAFVFQTFGLVPMLSASENVGLPLRLRRVPAVEREQRRLPIDLGLPALAEMNWIVRRKIA